MYYRNEKRKMEEELDLDRLYEKKRKRNLREKAVYSQVLTRVIRRINKEAENIVSDNKGILFRVPGYIPGEPTYNAARCAAWLITELEDKKLRAICDVLAGERVIYVSWKHYVPHYEREEIRKRTGLIVDANGEIIPDEPEVNEEDKQQEENKNRKKQRSFTPLQDFKPTRTGIYDEEQLRGVARKF